MLKKSFKILALTLILSLLFVFTACATDGVNGVNGTTPHIGENGNWWIGQTDTGISASAKDGQKGDTGDTGAKGDKGDKGDTGAKGDKGDPGQTGKSAYESYCEKYGFTGTEEEWLAQLNDKLNRYTSEQIYALAYKSVVKINSYDRFDNLIYSGSGFFVDANGTIATAYTVISGAHSIKVYTSDNTEYDVLTVLGFDQTANLAKIKIDPSAPTVHLSKGSETGVLGQTVYSFASNSGSFASGVITSAPNTNGFDFSAYIPAGNVGAPMISDKGDLIGITTTAFEVGATCYAANITKLDTVTTSYNKSVEDFFDDTVYYTTKLFDDEHGVGASNSLTIQNGYTVYGQVKGDNTSVDGNDSDSDLIKFKIDTPNSTATIVFIPDDTQAIQKLKLLDHTTFDQLEIDFKTVIINGKTAYYTSVDLTDHDYWLQINAYENTPYTDYLIYTFWDVQSEFAYDIPELGFIR